MLAAVKGKATPVNAVLENVKKIMRTVVVFFLSCESLSSTMSVIRFRTVPVIEIVIAVTPPNTRLSLLIILAVNS